MLGVILAEARRSRPPPSRYVVSDATSADESELELSIPDWTAAVSQITTP
jgi:hypothetical protein